MEKTTSPKIWDAVLKNLTIGQGPIAREIPVLFWPSEKVFVAHKFIIGATKVLRFFHSPQRLGGGQTISVLWQRAIQQKD